MRFPIRLRAKYLTLLFTSTVALTPLLLNSADAAKPKAKPKAPAASKIPAIFYDEVWSYRTATLYDTKKNIVLGVSGEAKFDRNGKYRQDYYIGNIGNFFKGTYKIQGDHLITFDEKGKKVFDFKFPVGTKPPILVLSLMDKGKKTIDYSLQPPEKKKTEKK